ncbi:MAG: PspC domain-containing protein [Flavobacteriia bacterium]|jgi:phage shock protein PspC (stress-responsive transcriptional regulator)|nr:PspC domain-containing protein [Flavobacteriia bacterium]NBV67397.1 PspC domain-containing protein [Flavobacteriia bacterium]NBV92608.1 PspC domain-containing protein [Flavobacteriia bacterium]NBY41437.1 PspC domain-containing protein [Flavobacteriia bacterium]
MKRQLQKIIFFFELQSYGVCVWWARKLGINLYKVRLGFIYLTFIGLGSPILLYLVMAWILEHKHYFKMQAKSKTSIWEL